MLLGLLPTCNPLIKLGATLPTIFLVLAVIDFESDDLSPAADSEAVVV